MKNIRLLQEPGFLWDLYFILYLNFNLPMISKYYVSKGMETEFAEVCKNIQIRFGDVPEDLYVFFHAIGTEDNTFLYSSYLKKFEKNFIGEYCVDFFQQELLDQNALIQNMIAFYLIEDNSAGLMDCLNSKEVLFDHIKKSNYSAEEKNKLYEFFINPAAYIALLHRTLISKRALLSDYYKENYKTIIDAYDHVAFDVLNDQMKKTSFKDIQGDGYVSYCLVDKFRFDLMTNSETYLYKLGYHYEYALDALSETTPELVLSQFGHALGDKKRVDILKLIHEKGEISCKDLERVFDFSGSTAYHHITTMCRVGILKSRNRGKTVLYSINAQNLKDIIAILNKLL